MKLVIEHESHRLLSSPPELEYAVYLEETDNFRDSLYPIVRFKTEVEARRYCELRPRGNRIAEYDL